MSLQECESFPALLLRILLMRLSQCLPYLLSRPYLLEEEETYEPPEDPDSGGSHVTLCTVIITLTYEQVSHWRS